MGERMTLYTFSIGIKFICVLLLGVSAGTAFRNSNKIFGYVLWSLTILMFVSATIVFEHSPTIDEILKDILLCSTTIIVLARGIFITRRSIQQGRRGIW